MGPLVEEVEVVVGEQAGVLRHVRGWRGLRHDLLPRPARRPPVAPIAAARPSVAHPGPPRRRRSSSTAFRASTTSGLAANSSKARRALRRQFGRSTPVPGTFCGSTSPHRSSRLTSSRRAGLAARRSRNPAHRLAPADLPLGHAASTQEVGHLLAQGGEPLARGLRLSLVEQPQVLAVGDVAPLPEAAEGRHVVGVEARRHPLGRLARQPAGPGRQLVLEHVHSEEAVAVQALTDLGRHGAEVLADQQRAVAVRLERQHGEQLVVGIAHVDAVLCRQPLRDPEQPLELHDMVDAQDAGVLQVVAQALDEMLVALRPLAVRAHRREAPALPLGEEGIGRGAGRGALVRTARLRARRRRNCGGRRAAGRGRARARAAAPHVPWRGPGGRRPTAPTGDSGSRRGRSRRAPAGPRAAARASAARARRGGRRRRGTPPTPRGGAWRR